MDPTWQTLHNRRVSPVRIDSARVTIVRRRRRRRIFAGLCAVACVLPVVHVSLLAVTIVALLYGSIAFFSQPAEPNFALAVERKAPGFLEVGDGFVTARSGALEVKYAANEVEEGWVASLWGRHVVLELRGGDLLAAEIYDAAAGDAILAAAKVRADQRTLDTKLAAGRWAGAWLAGTIVALWGFAAVGFLLFREIASRTADYGTLLVGGGAAIALAAISIACLQGVLPRSSASAPTAS